MSKTKKSTIQAIPKDGLGFEDMELFWGGMSKSQLISPVIANHSTKSSSSTSLSLSSSSHSNSKATPKSTISAATTPASEQDFNYEDTDSITEDEDDETVASPPSIAITKSRQSVEQPKKDRQYATPAPPSVSAETVESAKISRSSMKKPSNSRVSVDNTAQSNSNNTSNSRQVSFIDHSVSKSVTTTKSPSPEKHHNNNINNNINNTSDTFFELQDIYDNRNDELSDYVAKTKTPSNKSSVSFDATPATSRGISTPGSNDFTRGVSLDDSVYVDNEEESSSEEEEADLNDSFTLDKSFVESAKKKKKIVDSDDDDDGDLTDGAIRRSRRVTKGQKFAFWKNERPVYDQGSFVGLMMAVPTPRKRSREAVSRPARKLDSTKSKLFKMNDTARNNGEVIDTKAMRNSLLKREEELKPPKLPKGVTFIDRNNAEELDVWNVTTDGVETQKCVCHRESLGPLVPLPISGNRPANKNVAALAAQNFSMSDLPDISDWMAGFLELPPGAIKDAEGVGHHWQICFVADCQESALELAIADPSNLDWNDKKAQRQLLRKGDSFYIPPFNIYRLENHSSSITSIINWVMIKSETMPKSQHAK